MTTSSTRAASWTSGCARRACSNTAPAPAPTSRACAAKAKSLSGGGRSSGLMSFLKIGDRAAGAIKSRRHHAPRGQDGRGRRRPSRYRDLYRLEGEGGAEGRGARHRLQDQPEAPQGRAEGLRQLRRLGRRLLRSREEPGAAPRDQARAPRAGVRQRHQARDPVRQAGLQGHRLPDLRHRLGFGSLPHGIRPELQQLGLAEGRFPPRGRNRRRLESDRPHQQEGHQDAEGARALGKDRPRRLGLGRSRPALQHHHERLAHLQGVRRHPRVQSVLGIHVPGRHRVQPRLRQPDHVLLRPPPSGSTSNPTSISAGSGPSCSKSP